jgi:glutamyl-tRNA synthetase
LLKLLLVLALTALENIHLLVFCRDQLRGAATLLRYIGRASKLTGFYGVDPASSGEVDEWVDYAPTLAIGAEFERTCAYIDGYLQLRTFLAGYQLTIADIAVWAQLQGGCPNLVYALRG